MVLLMRAKPVRLLPQERNGRGMMAAALAVAAVLALAGGALAAQKAPPKAPFEPAMFTAYIRPVEWCCCVFSSPDGRVGYGEIGFPDSTSVFVAAPHPQVIRPANWGLRPNPNLMPESDVPVYMPEGL